MIKSEVIKACILNGKPKNPGDSVEVDENTFNNLVRKGVLKAAGAKAVKIVDVKELKAKEQMTTEFAAAAAAVFTPNPNHHGRHT